MLGAWQFNKDSLSYLRDQCYLDPWVQKRARTLWFQADFIIMKKIFDAEYFAYVLDISRQVSVLIFIFVSVILANCKIPKGWDLYLFNSVCTLWAQPKHQMGMAYFNNDKTTKHKSTKDIRRKTEIHTKKSYFRIMLYVICKIYFFTFIHEIILVFLFKGKQGKCNEQQK